MRGRLAGWVRIAAVVAVLALLGAACGGDEGDESLSTSTTAAAGGGENGEEGIGDSAGPQPTYGGSITVGIEAETNTWTPGTAQVATAGLVVANAIFDPLVAMSADGEYEPFLAESLVPDDDLSAWTLVLRDGVRFHDGTELDAEILKWNFDEFHFHSASLSYGLLTGAGVVGMEVVDSMTVRYDLEGPNAAFPDVLRQPVGWPVSRAAYEADPEGFGDHPVGTGPFVVEQWVRDDRMVVTRNDDYWRTADNGDRLPYLDQITFRPIADEESRIQSLAAGDIDVIQTLRGSSVKQVIAMAESGPYETSMHVGNESGAAILNVLEAPLDDVRIRRALAHVSDPHAIQQVLGDDGLTEVSAGFYSPDSPWYSSMVAEVYPGRDPDAARALVEDYRNDPERSDGKQPGDDVVIDYSCQPDPSLVEIAQLQQGLWQESGVVVRIHQVDASTHVANAVGTPDTDPPFRGTFQVNCWRAGGGDGDPLTALQSFFGPVATNPGNFTNFTHPEIDEQLEVLRTSPVFAERYAAVERITLIAAEELPLLWSAPTPSIVGFRHDLHGLVDWKLPSGSMGTGTPRAVPRFYEAFLAG